MDDPNEPLPAHPVNAPGFDDLLWDLFLRLMDVPGDQVEAVILDAQRRLCRALDLDRSTLWQTLADDPHRLRVTHLYTAEHELEADASIDGSVARGQDREFLAAGVSIPMHANASDFFPWVTQRVMDGETVAISAIDQLPADAAEDAASWQRFGTLSTVVVPLKAHGQILGCLSFAATRQARDWSVELVAKFERLAQVFAKALAKKRTDELLREHQARVAAAIDVAALGYYELRGAEQFLFIDERMRSLLGVREEQVRQALAFWAEHVHPDDQARVAGLSRRVREGDLDRAVVEYRYVHPQRGVTWFNHASRVLERDREGRALRLIGTIRDITERKRTEEQLQAALEDLRQLKDQLQRENLYLRDEIRECQNPLRIVGTSAGIRRVLDLVDQVASTASTVLLLGETGTGKERFAAAIHELSERRARPMVKVNCAAMPATLIESELFGREKGAYTGALTKQIGRFELANGSTIFLDEIGDLPLETQAKLVRVIETREFERLGSPNPVHVDVRIIAATNRDLGEAVRGGRFREDLFFRLNVFPILLPPLRERPEDIPLLVKAIVDELRTSMGKHVDSISRAGMQALQQYHWPGNIRELRNVVERAMISARGPVLHIELPAESARRPGGPGQTLQAFERDHVLEVLQQTGWRIRGPRGAAVILGLPPTTLENRMARLGIVRPGKNLPSPEKLPNTGGR